MTKFADQLFDDLMREHGDVLRTQAEAESVPVSESVPVPARSRRRGTRPAWLTAGLVAGTGAVAGGFVLFGGAVTPAYAVTLNSNGTVTVTVSQASAIDAANTKLTALGVHAVVVPVRAGCPSLSSVTVQIPPGNGRAQVSVSSSQHDGQISSITVDAKGVPADETMVLAFDSSHDGTFGASGFVKGKVPDCVSLPTAPVGH